MKKILITLIGLVVFQVNAQDVHSSQFWNNALQYNAAMTGMIKANVRASAYYKDQWSAIGAQYQTYGASFDTRFETRGNTAFGVGVDLYRDQAGDLQFGTTNAQLTFATILAMDRHNKMSIGVKGGMVQKGFDLNAAQWNSQYQNGSYNAALGSGESFGSTSEMVGDLSVGFAYSYSTSERYMTANDEFNFVFGASLNHILKPKFEWIAVDPDALYRNLVVHAEAQIGVPNSKWTLIPAIITQFQGPSQEILFGSQYRLKLKDASRVTGFVKGAYLNFGTFYRWGDAFIPSITYEFDHYSIGVSYDVNTSQLRTASNGNGGFEISIKFRTPNPYLWQGSRSRSRIR